MPSTSTLSFARQALRRLAVSFSAVFLLLQVGCGGGSSTATSPPAAAEMHAGMRVLAEPPGPNCANGGYRYDLGQDLDGNGKLDDSEAKTSAYVCPGAETDTVL